MAREKLSESAEEGGGGALERNAVQSGIDSPFRNLTYSLNYFYSLHFYSLPVEVWIMTLLWSALSLLLIEVIM